MPWVLGVSQARKQARAASRDDANGSSVMRRAELNVKVGRVWFQGEDYSRRRVRLTLLMKKRNKVGLVWYATKIESSSGSGVGGDG